MKYWWWWEMRSCEINQKICLVAGISLTALFYIFFPIFYIPSFDSWHLTRYNISMKKTSYDNMPSRLHNVTTKKILFWNTMFGDETFYFGNGDIFDKCQGIGRNCFATPERSDMLDFDAILFHGSQLTFIDIPSTRSKRQNYIFVNLESPENHPIPYSQFEEGYFNLTMTYRLDSDLIWSYADIRSFEDGSIVAPSHDVLWHTRLSKATDLKGTGNSHEVTETSVRNTRLMRKNKSKSAIWFVSNCQSKSKREKYIEELATYIDVDIYGKCGNKDGCSRNVDCFTKLVEPHYYFYLSFENSMCQDYVTEKLYNALKHDVVPVVYGGANYSLFAPPRSYINALDFDSPKELAIYLKRLIAKPSEYDKYFEWKNKYEVVNSADRVICQLCEYLHENNRVKFYSNLSDWYENDKCPLQDQLLISSYLTRKNVKNQQ